MTFSRIGDAAFCSGGGGRGGWEGGNASVRDFWLVSTPFFCGLVRLVMHLSIDKAAHVHSHYSYSPKPMSHPQSPRAFGSSRDHHHDLSCIEPTDFTDVLNSLDRDYHQAEIIDTTSKLILGPGCLTLR
jgi:hypothetical protein